MEHFLEHVPAMFQKVDLLNLREGNKPM